MLVIKNGSPCELSQIHEDEKDAMRLAARCKQFSRWSDPSPACAPCQIS